MSKMWGIILSLVVALLVVANVALWMHSRGGGGDGRKALARVDSLMTWTQQATPKVRNLLCLLQWQLDSIEVTAHGGHVGPRPEPFRCLGTSVPASDPPKCCP